MCCMFRQLIAHIYRCMLICYYAVFNITSWLVKDIRFVIAGLPVMSFILAGSLYNGTVGKPVIAGYFYSVYTSEQGRLCVPSVPYAFTHIMNLIWQSYKTIGWRKVVAEDKKESCTLTL